MNFTQAVSFPFKDAHWFKKCAFAALIGLLPVVGQIFLLGWAIEITRRVIVQEDPIGLPVIDFAHQLYDGLRIWVGHILYTLPIFFLLTPILALAGYSGENPTGSLEVLATVVVILLGTLLGFYALVALILSPAALGILASDDDLRPALSIRNTWELVRAAPGAYALTILGAIISLTLAQVGLLFCVVGVSLTLTYALAVNAHLIGQAYNQAFALDHSPAAGSSGSSKDST